MGKHVLLLGASGFIGQAILRTLLEQGYTVMALKHSKPIQVVHERLHIIPASIGSINLQRLPFAPDIIIHAARNRTGRFGKLGRRLVAGKGNRENKRLLQQVRTLANKPFIVYCSGSLMYGSHKGILIDESFPVTPVSFAREYVKAEEPFLKAIEQGDLDIFMLRLPWVIGLGSWFKWNYLDIMQARGYVPLYGNGDNVMSFVDIDSIGKIIIELVSCQHNGIFNVRHPQHLTQKQWADLLSSASGLPVKKLDSKEEAHFGAAVLEAFNTHIALTSQYKTLQEKLSRYHPPLEDVVEKCLASFQHK